MAAVVEAYLRAALARGLSSLHARMSEIMLDMESHQMEIARLTVERDALAAKLETIASPSHEDSQ